MSWPRGRYQVTYGGHSYIARTLREGKAWAAVCKHRKGYAFEHAIISKIGHAIAYHGRSKFGRYGFTWTRI